MYQNLHKDVLLAMIVGLTNQMKRGDISSQVYNAEITPIMTELYDRQSERLQQLESDFKQLKEDQNEQLKSHATDIGIYDAFLEEKGLTEEFEEFESRWWEAWGKERSADG